MWDIKEKTCLITGATSGIGLEMAKSLAAAGAKVRFTYRDAVKAEKARHEIIQHSGNKDVLSYYCDLSSMDSVRAFAAAFRSSNDSLHVLINNAGTWFTSRQLTVDGYEANFATNHLGPFLLTMLLLDNVKNAGNARIINVASSAHYAATMNFEDIHLEKSYNWFRAYSQSKLANILFTRKLSEMHKENGITVNCLHPGVVRTAIFRDMSPITRFFLRFKMISPAKGADTAIFLATSEAGGQITGKYFVKRKVKKSSAASHDMDAAERLWKLSLELTGLTQN